MTVILGISCEDEGHYTAVTKVIDDHVTEHVGWLAGILEHGRKWRGVRENEVWYKYDREDAKLLGRKHHGKIAGEPLKDEAKMWRVVLEMFCLVKPLPDVVVLVRDMDGAVGRRQGAEQVRKGIPWPFAIVIATPQPEVEAWWVSGFKPQDESEEKLLATITKNLSFDPTKESHRLTSHPNDSDTDAKKILDQLCGDEPDRLNQCLSDRDHLRARGNENGFADFVNEVEGRIIPVFQGKHSA